LNLLGYFVKLYFDILDIFIRWVDRCQYG